MPLALKNQDGAKVRMAIRRLRDLKDVDPNRFVHSNTKYMATYADIHLILDAIEETDAE